MIRYAEDLEDVEREQFRLERRFCLELLLLFREDISGICHP
jgi:hypothetical protein